MTFRRPTRAHSTVNIDGLPPGVSEPRFGRLWRHLQAQGWRLENGRGHASFHYVPPGDGSRVFFTSRGEVWQHATKHSLFPTGELAESLHKHLDEQARTSHHLPPSLACSRLL